MFETTVQFIRERFGSEGVIPLHEPVFAGNEKRYLAECIDTTFVSSVGKFVDEFERRVAEFVGSRHAVAVVNGTQALFVALKLAGAEPETEVLTQSLSFVATANAISYTGARPVFLDVEPSTLGLSPHALEAFLEHQTCSRDGRTVNRQTGRPLAACVPMHTFGHPCRIDRIQELCNAYQIPLIEDAAESLGSFYRGRHTGTFGLMGAFSFNGNKIVTTGGGGMLVTDDETLARRAKHLTTTAKLPHRWEFIHDELGYNFRLPNLNAALGVAQMEMLPAFLSRKRELASAYCQFFGEQGGQFANEPLECESNYWLNALILEGREQRDAFLAYTNDHGVMTRPLWQPLHLLPMYSHCQHDGLEQTLDLYQRVVNLPSSVKL